MKVIISLAVILLSLNVVARVQDDLPGSCDGRDLRAVSRNFIYRFSYRSECEAALEQSRLNEGRFCDRTRLVRHDGIILGGFTFSSECTEALAQILYSQKGLFCNKTNMMSITKGYLTTFSLSTHCQDAIVEARENRGLFCNKNQMFTHKGQMLGTYRLSSECQQSLAVVAQDYPIFGR